MRLTARARFRAPRGLPFVVALVLGAFALGPALASAQDRSDGLPGLPPVAGSTITTGFEPRGDGGTFVNTGDYASEGDCLGLSLIAVSNFLARRAASGSGPLQPAPPARGGAEVYRQQAIAGNFQAQVTLEYTTRVGVANPTRPLADPTEGVQLQALLRTGEPAVITFDGTMEGQPTAHAVVAYGFRDGHFLIYDPNDPTNPHTLAFDPKTGFGAFDEGGEPYSTMSKINVVRASDFNAVRELPALTAACDTLADSCTARYPKVDFTLERDGANVVISGRPGPVPAGLKATSEGQPASVSVYVNDAFVADGEVVDGAFRVTLPKGSIPSSAARVEVALRTAHDGLAGIGHQNVTGGPGGAPAPSTPPSTVRPQTRATTRAAATPPGAGTTPTTTPGFVGPLGGVGR